MENKTMKLVEGAELIGVIQQTYDYDKFKIHPKNRKVRQDKVEEIMKSMSYRDILNPILTNENMEIAEGQHRYFARKQIGLPIFFIVVEGLDVEAMQILNNNETKSNWTHEDYLEMYIKEDMKDYIIFNKIIKKYRLNFSDLMHIICELSSNEAVGEREALVKFDEGKFVLDCNEEVIDFLEELSVFDRYDWSRHTSFVRALFKLYIEEFYNKEHIRRRVEIGEYRLKDGKRSTITEYGKFIADLYTDIKRGVRVIYDVDGGEFHDIGKQGRRKKKRAI